MGFISSELEGQGQHLRSRVKAYLGMEQKEGGFGIVGNYDGKLHALILNGGEQLLIVYLENAHTMDKVPGIREFADAAFGGVPLNGSKRYDIRDNLYLERGQESELISYKSYAVVKLILQTAELDNEQIAVAVNYCVRELGKGTDLNSISGKLSLKETFT